MDKHVFTHMPYIAAAVAVSCLALTACSIGSNEKIDADTSRIESLEQHAQETEPASEEAASDNVSTTVTPLSFPDPMPANPILEAINEKMLEMVPFDNQWSYTDVPDGGLTFFSLNPNLDGSFADGFDTSRVENAIGNIEQRGECSFVMVNMSNGQAVSYNPHSETYMASSVKAVMAYYILTQTDLDQLTDYRRNAIELAIVASDNDAYDELQNWYYYNDSFVEWLAGYGIEHSVYDENGGYPDAGAASVADIWNDIAQYIEEGSEDALWLYDLLSSTEISFIRGNLDREDVSVANKGGWIADSSLNAVNDCAILTLEDGSRYLLVILTSQPSVTDSIAAVGELSNALIEIMCPSTEDGSSFEETNATEEEIPFETEQAAPEEQPVE